MSRYPQLDAARGTLAPGVSYACAYMRLEHGWSLERAISQPVHVPKPKPIKRAYTRKVKLIPGNLRESAAYVWDRPGWNRTVAGCQAEKKAPVVRKRYVRHAEDTSPAHIRRIRTAFCDQFIKFGTLDQGLMKQLKDYADERRAANKHLTRISDEHAASRHCPAAANAGDDRRRDADQIDAGAAKRISEFLRT